jgi:hypothetical protein
MNPEDRKPLEMEILASANGCWGKAGTLEEAKKLCRKAGGKGKTAFILLPKGVTVDGVMFGYPQDAKFIATKLGTL